MAAGNEPECFELIQAARQEPGRTYFDTDARDANTGVPSVAVKRSGLVAPLQPRCASSRFARFRAVPRVSASNRFPLFDGNVRRTWQPKGRGNARMPRNRANDSSALTPPCGTSPDKSSLTRTLG